MSEDKKRDFDGFIEEIEKKMCALKFSERLKDQHELKEFVLNAFCGVMCLPRLVVGVVFSIMKMIFNNITIKCTSVKGTSVSPMRAISCSRLCRRLLEEEFVQGKILKGLDYVTKKLDTYVPVEIAGSNLQEDEWKEIQTWLFENQERLSDCFKKEVGAIKEIQALLQPQPLKKHLDYINNKNRDGYSVGTYGIEEFLSPTRGSIRFCGREKEITALDEFLDSKYLFSLWVVEGASGSGKTRLALEWMSRRFKEDSEWNAGFLSTYEGWGQWLPLRPTFLVIDYFTRNSNVVKILIDRLQTLGDDEKSICCPVRILVLDHSFDFKSMVEDKRWSVGSTEEQEFMRVNILYDEKSLKIDEAHDEMLKEIVKNVAGGEYNEDKGRKAMEWLTNTRGANRPLFAALAGGSIKEIEKETFEHSSRRGLIFKYLKGHNRVPWENEESSKEYLKNELIGGYVCCSTVLDGKVGKNFLEKKFSVDRFVHCHFDVVWQEACIIVGQKIIEKRLLEGLLPDILGETFFLEFMGSGVSLCAKEAVAMAIFNERKWDCLGNILEFCRRTSLNICQDMKEQDYIEIWSDFLLEHAQRIKSEKGRLMLALAKIEVSTTFFQKREGFRERGDVDEIIKKLLHDIDSKLLVENMKEFKEGVCSVIERAFVAGNVVFVRKIVAKGWDVNTFLNEDKITPLLIASENGHQGIVELLLESGVCVDQASEKDKVTPLMIASAKGHENIVTLLIKEGADVNLARKDSATALMLASEKGHEDIVTLLIENKAEVNHEGNSRATSLMTASREGHKGIVELLIDKGANVNHATNSGWTSLMAASDKGRKSVVELLIKKEADINHTDKDGWTSLMAASDKGHKGVVELLIERGIDVNHNAKSGWTSLMLASEKGHEGVVKVLLENKADTKKENNNGSMAINFAISKGHDSIVKMIEEYDRDNPLV